MNDEQREIFEYRKSIVDNADRLIQHGQKFKKNKSVGQLSLFGSQEIEISRFDIERKQLSDHELSEMAAKEVESIGLPITYDKFSEFILIEKTLCTRRIEDVFFSEDKQGSDVFLATVKSYETRTSKSGNKYAKVFAVRDNIEMKLYLFGEDYENQKNMIAMGKIHIIKILRNGDMTSIKKIQPCDQIDVSKYIESIVIEIPEDLSKITNIRNYVFLNVKNAGNIKIKYKWKDYDYEEDSFTGNLTSENCDVLMRLGCKITINKLQ